MAGTSEQEELQAKIAAITGKINEHKQHQHQQHPPQAPLTPHPPTYHPPHHGPQTRSYRARWSPYGRGGRGRYAKPHVNRTLVLGGAHASPPPASAATPNTTTAEAGDGGFVSTRAPGRTQLMSKDTFEREQKQLLQYKQHARAASQNQINRDEQNTVMQHVHSFPASNNREVIVDGLRFQLREDGSKLIRIRDPQVDHRDTPKKFTLAGVDFCRTKTGNLVRINAVRGLVQKSAPPQCEQFAKHGTQFPFRTNCQLRTRASPGKKRYVTDTSTGNCPFGATCKFSHDPNKVAMCKTFLHKGSCPAGDACDLSHESTYHRVPACTHFLRGNCTNPTCPYPHIRVSESAPVCRSFSQFFYCPLGDDCGKRHLFVCADHVNYGKCDKPKCSLPHPDHASALRKAAARRAKTGSEDESDWSSNDSADDEGIDDVDSDAAEEMMVGANDDDHALSQQHDFVSFE